MHLFRVFTIGLSVATILKPSSKNNTKRFDFIDGNPFFFKNIKNIDFQREWPWKLIFLKSIQILSVI
jgi:hypothetical protein